MIDLARGDLGRPGRPRPGTEQVAAQRVLQDRQERDRRLVELLLRVDLRDQLQEPPELAEAQAADLGPSPPVEPADAGELVPEAEGAAPAIGGTSAAPMAPCTTRRI